MKNLMDRKLIKFLFVGVVNTMVGSVIMFSLYNLAHCSYWTASAANYILTSILSFFLNKYFTFQNRTGKVSQIVRFILNIGLCYLLAYGIARPICRVLLLGAGKQMQDNISMLAGMGLFTIFNYLGQRLFVFQEP